MMYSAFRAVSNMAAFCGLIAGLLPVYALCLTLAPRKRHRISRTFFRGCVALTGLRLNVVGKPAPDMAIYAANHASYLDIPILGALLSQGTFVAKNDVASWPVFGFLARLSRTIFISRKPAAIRYQCKQMRRRIDDGAALILFPEGTSTDGAHVRAFKSSLFACLDGVKRDAWVQPVSIAYTRHKDGTPLDQAAREQFTWFGDMTLVPHLFNVFGSPGCEVDVVFHAPLSVENFPGRKALTMACWRLISNQVGTSIGASVLQPVTPVTDNEAAVAQSVDQAPRRSSSLSASA